MDYKAISLKYRPQILEELVGQERVVKSLRAALETKKIHHAYLFSGPRGVGKTSSARILAKSLNCIEGPTVKPCGVCDNCKEIKEGRCIDVIEIDGASNRGIDEVRTLRENVKFSPVNSRYKIYIIDEVHMLTEPAFNALLKTLEEPPQHVRFILATTHLHKLPPTILSRCQKLSFSLVPASVIVERLKRIAVAEHAGSVDDTVLFNVAKASGGSIRDAESVFDQILPVVSDPDFVKHMYSFLGIIEEGVLSEFFLNLARRRRVELLALIERVVSEGRDLGEFLRDSIEYARNILLVKIEKPFIERVECAPETKEIIVKYAAAFSESALVTLIDEFIDAHRKAKALHSLRIPLELAVLKWCGVAKDERGVSGSEPATAQRSAPVAQSRPVSVPQKPILVPRPAPGIRPPLRPSADRPESAAGGQGPMVRDASQPFLSTGVVEEKKTAPLDEAFMVELKAKWDELANKIKVKSILLGSYLEKANVCSVNVNTVTCSFPQNLSFHKEHLEDKENLKLLEGMLRDFLHREVRIKFVLNNTRDATMESYAKKKKPDTIGEEDVSMINDIVSEFQGKVMKEDA